MFYFCSLLTSFLLAQVISFNLFLICIDCSQVSFCRLTLIKLKLSSAHTLFRLRHPYGNLSPLGQ